MHIGRNNQKYKYTITYYKNGIAHQLEDVREERDLGVIVADNLKWLRQKATELL